MIEAVSKTFDIIENEPYRMARLYQNTQLMRKLLLDKGFDLGTSDYRIPILPLHVGGTYRVFLDIQNVI